MTFGQATILVIAGFALPSLLVFLIRWSKADD
jgi:hypothetical protein